MTRQDWVAWFWVLDGLAPELCHALRHLSREADERDAELMVTLLRRGCRFCRRPANEGLGEVFHASDCVYVEDWPR